MASHIDHKAHDQAVCRHMKYEAEHSFVKKEENRSRRWKHFILCYLAMAAAVMVIVLSMILVSGNSIQAEEDDHAVQMYTSIQIQPGDSLWSIASVYADGHYSSIREYIEEAKFINELSCDTIHAYEYLLVPYYKL